MGSKETYTVTCNALLVVLLMCAYFSGPTVALRQEVEDFEFADTESEMVKTVVKRAVDTDDEDFLMDEPGSGPDDNYEGSGTEEPPVITVTPKVGPSQRYIRLKLNLTGIIYSADLADRNSVAFKNLAARVKFALETLFRRIGGQQLVSVISFERGSVIATIDVASLEDSGIKEIERILLEALQQGQIGNLDVSPSGFRMETLDAEVQCPDFVGRMPTFLPRSGSNKASLLVNNAFPCEGKIVGWEYYRLIPQGIAYVGVWRQQSDSEFVLVRKTELPPAPTGVRSVPVDDPIQVEQGDFIGIFYPRATPNNIVASSTPDENFVPARELYQNYLTGIYNDEIQEGVPIDLNTVDLTAINSTFALRALMDYERGPGPDTTYTCAPDQFTCDDGFCIKKEYECDGQNDCNDGSDEVGCPTDPDSGECLEGRSRCDDGTCINRGLRCNGVEDCPDGSDERRCIECSIDEFTCTNGDCVPYFVRCNQEKNCADGSDELNCPSLGCTDAEFQCGDDVCIRKDKVCNNIIDCNDGSDELDCIFTCSPSEFTCDNGECIDARSQCNGIGDCVDGSDERGCPCRDDQFECAPRDCISLDERCDGKIDCSNRRDELNCPRCARNEFECGDGTCIDIRSRCDRFANCRDSTDEFNCTCGAAEFRCDNGQCVPIDRRCDRRSNCVDGSDEANCPPQNQCRDASEFLCGSGECISRDQVCNRIYNCRDRSDEVDCPTRPRRCRANMFQCDTGHCLQMTRRCDGRRDCPNGSDEDDCPTCGPNEFTCESSGRCIPLTSRCNQRIDCADRSDERNCVETCSPDEFTCETSGRCIPLSSRCDQRIDCADRSDERNCVETCSPDEFTCETSGRCIPLSSRCDQRTDCADRSDERNCPCRDGEFTCVSDGRCLPPGYQCNGNAECRDGSDEENCVIECRAGEFTCESGQCIPEIERCNRQYNCIDGSDERGCECGPGEFRCDSGQCISDSARCNQRYECSDRSDEADCASPITINVTPQQLRVRAGREATFYCQVSGRPTPRVEWTRRTGGAMPPQATQDGSGRLVITNARTEDGGDYLCTATSGTQTAEAIGRLAVDYIGPPTSRPDPDGPCGRDEATCTNGECIPRDYVCDAEDDCTDGSDELECSVALPCEPNEFRCNNGRCALKIWRCDGDDDCFDRSDELNCPSRIPGAPCNTDEFTCRTNQQCIPYSYQCDGEIDCLDRSDEVGCSAPTIVTPPIPEITVEINGTFTIVCEAVGVPTPLIVWRLNWGNIPTGPRITVTSINGRGVLEVRNAIPSDAGAYTCEAINNRGSIFAIPDALIIVRRTVGVCDPPYFNAEANALNECVRCFCFGQTQTCYSSDLQLSQITLGDRVQLVNRPGNEPAQEGFVQYLPISREFEVQDFSRALRAGSWYWSLPSQYLSKRLSSYGGELTYQVFYEVGGFTSPTNDPDVVLVGNGITLTHRSKSQFRPRARTTVSVPLVETAWERSRDNRRPGSIISDYASREDLMMVLANVTGLYIRATYDNSQSSIKLGNVLLTTGVTINTGLGRAVFVEECTCPPGYTGDSCEVCDRGFYHKDGGPFGQQCVACECSGRSNDCDPFTGVCRNCRDNFVGPYCNECPEGYLYIPRSGLRDRCEACPCPLTTPENQFSRTCQYRDGDIVCLNCPVGYTGRQCERCDDGYVGDPRIPGQRCRKREDPTDLCDSRGSIASVSRVVTGQCSCKPNTQGQYCDQCKPETFYLSGDFPYGCISCFCMGVTQTCQSTTWNRAQIILTFSQSPAGVVLTDLTRRNRIDDNLSINRVDRELVHRGTFRSRDTYYWSLPVQFLGDKVSAYGGNLRFTIRYRSGRDSSPLSRGDPLVEISGNDITLMYRLQRQPAESRQQSFSIPFIENQWERMDGERATREHLLMTLADLDAILIRALYSVDTEETAISSISLDIAEERVTGLERAYAVEQCACPRGYKGLSCEDCTTGYTRTGNGLYLGLCEPCQCNGHSSQCDPETGVCINCLHNTGGDKCERCARGFYGDATRGSVNDCQRCPCPLTEAPNQFSVDCILDTDNQVTCTSCPPGHMGRRCERCTDGYTGNPMQLGDFCKVINVTCDCDQRGTLPNTLCNPDTQQCQCKTYAVGRRCSSCQDGYFYLSRDNEQGCLDCFCMGVSTQCTSSNYYRQEITPMLNPDGTHNFALTNRRMSRTITDGFSMNADLNEITFNNFEGIQRERESLYLQMPPKFRGDKITSYGGYLRFGLSYTTAFDTGRDYPDVDVEIIGRDDKRMYYLFRPSPSSRMSYDYDILLTESSFRNLMDGQVPSRETFLTVLADIDSILIRATYHTMMTSFTLRNVRMDIAVPRPTGLKSAPEVESCVCPEGYTGLSCQECAAGYLRVLDGAVGLGRCVRCNCNGHANSCDPETGICQNCLHNTEGDRCERCARGYYGDATGGTPNDCRVCACPLTLPNNQFSPTCFLDQDNRVTCDRCPTGYTGRDCGTCAPKYRGNPREPNGRCVPDEGPPTDVVVNPTVLTEPLGSTAVFQCNPQGRGPFNVVWSRLDGGALPRRAITSPGPNYLLTITELEYADSARYVCTVTSIGGTSRGYVSLTVERPETPLRIRIEEPTTLEVRRGQTARFICVAVQYSSAANYILAWTKDAGQLPEKAVDQNGVLIIPNIQDEDIGTYRCTGSDPASSDTATAVITFGSTKEAPTVRIEPRYLQISEGDTVEFRCISTGSPTPTVRWTKGPDGPLPDYIITDDNGLLRIPSAVLNDQSEYYCSATNSEGTTSVRTIVYVQRSERVEVIVRRAIIEASIGGSEQLVCYTQAGDDQVRLVWSREGGLPPGTSDRDGILTLTNIQRSYAGNYICTATSPTGILGRATVRVTVSGRRGEAPTVRIEPERQTIGTGTTGTLRCIVTGEPRPQITWTKGSGVLSSNHQVNGEILRILQASMDDRDVYVCTAENMLGRAQDTAIVDIERREPPEIELYPSAQQTRPSGSSAMFQCRVVGGIPAPTLVWTRAGGLDFTPRTEVKTENGVLMFTDLTTDEQGEYMCSATNEVGTVTATASIRVEGPPAVTITPSNRITALVGERVNIECVGIGEPTPTVFWRSEQRRRSDVLPEAFDVDETTARLIFDPISESDAGRYICTAANPRGKTEQAVDVIVTARQGPRVVIPGPERLSLTVGESVDLTCSAEGIPNARIRWRRPGNAPLPPGHSVRNGVLRIPRLDPEDSGEYICTVTTDISPSPFTASVYIIVRVSPGVTISPARVVSRPGQPIYLRCQPSGTGPFNIEWTRLNGPMNPQARERDGVLEIRQVTRADAGRYRCRATNSGGSSEGFADVTIIAPPLVDVTPKQNTVALGATLEIVCDVRGDPPPTIRWNREDGELPLQHRVRNGILTLYNLQPEDSGRYICTASNDGGTARDYTYVRVDRGGIIPGSGVQTVEAGRRVEFECVITDLGSGDSQVTATWSRIEGPLPSSAVIGRGILIIEEVKPEDSGTYRCTATNQAGSVTSEVKLIVQSPPIISVQQDYTTASLGSPAQLRCEAAGSPQPRISWMKEDGDLPDDHSIVDGGDLLIPRVREEDAGKYTCLASNSFGTSQYPVILVVGALVPYFQQNPLSYIAYDPLNDVYLDLDILLSFRPESTDGLVLYNGQYNSGSGDYVCFGLREAFPEFRFDIGAGPAVIRGSQPLELNRWHTVHLTRNRRNGSLVVNEEPAYTSVAPGDFQGLDLAEPLYVGAVPDFRSIPRSAAYTSGFVGGVSQIKIKGIALNLGGEAREIVGVEPYLVCRDSPCMNNGFCEPYNNAMGFVCNCPRGFAGERCERRGQQCYAGACGPNGRCVNLSSGDGFTCICPIGFTGERCSRGLTIIDPAFNKTSFISYPKINDGLMSVRLRLMFKPRSLDDGIILYNAQKQDGKQDFVAVIIRNLFLEFRFDTGSGPAVLRSRNPLLLNQWTMVMADRKGRDGMLIVNNEEAVNELVEPNDNLLFSGRDRGDVSRGSTPRDGTVGLNLERPLFLGGVDPSEEINRNTGVFDGFIGCIGELQINEGTIDLIEDAIESVNIQDCGDRSLCNRRPCRNNGRCVDISPTEYRCDCTEGFTGDKCELEIDVCVVSDPCINDGECYVTKSGVAACDCPLGFMGRTCETVVEIGDSIELSGNGYTEFRRDILPHRRRQTSETVQVTFSTIEPNGLIFWQGQRPGEQGGKDYLAIILNDGFLEFRYELGSGPAVITSNVAVNDGFKHTVIAERLGKEGSLTVDDNAAIEGMSSGPLQVLNVHGNIFFGGVPDLARYTAGLFNDNFVGCLSMVKIQGNDPLNFGIEPIGALNVQPCLDKK